MTIIIIFFPKPMQCFCKSNTNKLHTSEKQNMLKVLGKQSSIRNTILLYPAFVINIFVTF